MAEIEIGMGKTGRRAYGLDDLALVPSRRTRDPEDIDLSWEIDAFTFDLPIMASAMDSVVSPASAVAIGELGGAGVLALEGLWTRYDDPEQVLAEIAGLTEAGVADDRATARLQELYAEPIKPELIRDRIKEIRGAGVTSCASITPQRLPALADALLAAELDLLVVQGSVVSAEHVTKDGDPLNLKTFVRRFDIPVIVGGCASYQAARHLMRTGAAGILVGVGSGATSTTRRVLGVGAAQATAIADARAARMRHLDETGVYVHLIADGGIRTGGDIAKAVACGADAVMIGAPLAAASDAPGRGWHWGLNGGHADLPRAERVPAPPVGTLEEVLVGPAHRSDGSTNLAGGLRRSMASCGYRTLKELQKAELTITPVHP
ncbi:MAG: dehydrogenase family protein [Ilumatobacteraceae bacterium]|nr:dehydrogenase family protein [Ilumatobacteraceae bacterium]